MKTRLNPGKQIDRIAGIFNTLGDPTRLKIVGHLLDSGKLCVGALAQRLGITQSAVSQQLKLLKTSGILDADRIGNHVHYFIDDDFVEKYPSLFRDLKEQLKGAVSCPTCPPNMK